MARPMGVRQGEGPRRAFASLPLPFCGCQWPKHFNFKNILSTLQKQSILLISSPQMVTAIYLKN
jgi:hypothetical protein